MAQSLQVPIGWNGFSTNLPFGICAIYDRKVFDCVNAWKNYCKTWISLFDAWIKWHKNIIPNGGFFMVMHPMVESV